MYTRTIEGKSYYPKKASSGMQCIHCLQRISQHSIAYARGSKDSGVSLCEQCMNQFSAQYREQKYGALIFKSTDELYIGLLGHACSKLDPLGFTVRKMLFQRVWIPVLHCQKCSRYYVDVAEYQKHWRILREYHLYHTLTGKPIPGSGADPSMSIPPIAKKKNKKSTQVGWNMTHPVQGGSCSGK